MKYIYSCKIKNEEWVCYAVAVVVLILVIISDVSSYIDNGTLQGILSTEWLESIISQIIFEIFLIYCGMLIGSERKNFKKWESNLIKNGIKCEGEVTEIRLWNKNLYELKVCYYSQVQEKYIIFSLPKIQFRELIDTSKLITCNVYESTEYHDIKDYEAEVIKVCGNKIYFNINPIKLLKVVHEKYTRKWFGNAVAENFKYK
jgi:hypothetical protein